MTEFNNKKPLTKVSGIHYKKNIDNIVSKNEVTSFCNITKLFKEKKTGCGMAECFTPLEEQENINKTNYIQLIHDCSIRELIVPSLYRQLTEKGRKNVEDVFENKLEEKLDYFLGVTQKLRLLNPDLSEMDAFIYEAADCIWAMNKDLKPKMEEFAMKEQISTGAICVLGAIYLVEQAIEKGTLFANPKGSPRDSCYLQYIGQ